VKIDWNLIVLQALKDVDRVAPNLKNIEYAVNVASLQHKVYIRFKNKSTNKFDTSINLLITVNTGFSDYSKIDQNFINC
jgi:hypothetical protein